MIYAKFTTPWPPPAGEIHSYFLTVGLFWLLSSPKSSIRDFGVCRPLAGVHQSKSMIYPLLWGWCNLSTYVKQQIPPVVSYFLTSFFHSRLSLTTIGYLKRQNKFHMRSMCLKFSCLFLIHCWFASAMISAQTSLPAILSDNMCIQQDAVIKIWE